MAMSEIMIYRDLPSVNGHVQIPPCREKFKTKRTLESALDVVDGSTVVRLSIGSGKAQGSKCGQQEMLRLPGVAADSWYASDPLAGL